MSAASRLVPVFLDRDALRSCFTSADIMTFHEWYLYSVIRFLFPVMLDALVFLCCCHVIDCACASCVVCSFVVLLFSL